MNGIQQLTHLILYFEIAFLPTSGILTAASLSSIFEEASDDAISAMIFYDLEYRNINGERVTFESYRNKVCLVVNIASHCRYTPQLKDLQTLYHRYKNSGLEILAFPSNDFGEQEPLSNREINDFCLLNFSSTFTIFEKSHVKGKYANPVFHYLSHRRLNGSVSSKPWWNFHKYLIGRDGHPATYFYTFTRPLSARLIKAIEKLLAE